jgi:hypothetical protein
MPIRTKNRNVTSPAAEAAMKEDSIAELQKYIL